MVAHVRRYDDPVEVRRGTVSGQQGTVEGPELFLWQGRLWKVYDVVGHWRETGAWWRSPEVASVLGTDTAVAAVADARKGERLILFTEAKGATRAAYQTFAKGCGASDLAIPAEVVVLETLPMLGTGKVDQVGVTKLAKERAATAEAA